MRTHQIITHPSVVDRLQDFPRKYIKFNTHEKDLVISLFDVIAKVRKEVEGESYTVDDSITANYTKVTLQKRAHYSELVAASIVRWHLHRESGRKERNPVERYQLNLRPMYGENSLYVDSRKKM